LARGVFCILFCEKRIQLQVFAFIGISHPYGRSHFFFTYTDTSSTLSCCRKDAKKVSKLEAQIPYHEGRGNKDEVDKIKEQIDAIWEKAREAAMAM